MNRIEAYKLRKKIEVLGKTMYVVESTREGVEPIKEVPVIEFFLHHSTKRYAPSGGKWGDSVYVTRFKLHNDNFPYEVDIDENKMSGQQDGYSSGFGDLWHWTYFHSLSKEEAEEYFKKETIRVTEKYLSGKQDEYVYIPAVG